jgi:hypothetical protein
MLRTGRGFRLNYVRISRLADAEATTSSSCIFRSHQACRHLLLRKSKAHGCMETVFEPRNTNT